MDKQNKFIYILSRASNLLIILLLFCACSKEQLRSDGDFLGKWRLTKVTVNGNDKILTVSELDSTLYFKQIGIMELNGHSQNLQRSGWSYNDGILNIAIHLPASYYVQELTDTDMELKRLDFANGNNISTTITHFQRTQ